MSNSRFNFLKQKQSLPLEAKIKLSQRRIEEWYDYWDGHVYISFSGGKDSTVLRHIVKSIFPDVPVVFVDTGLEYPEVRNFAIANADIILEPELTFRQVIEQYGYPIVSKKVAEAIEAVRNNIKNGNTNTVRYQQLMGTAVDKNGNPSIYNKSKWKYLLDAPFKISSKCCNVMKIKPIILYERQTLLIPYVGTMASESLSRRTAYFQYGCNAFNAKNPSSKPLSIWTENDILKYLKIYNIEYSPIYGNIEYDEKTKCYKNSGVKRTGCMFCGFGVHMEKEPNRFQQMKLTHPEIYNYCINGGEYVDGMWQPSKEGLGMGKVLNTINVKY